MSSPLWLVDRSRISDGRGFCQRARLLGYHIGPNGYGITMKATRLPLMTGIAGHDGLAPILQWCQEHPDWIEVPPDEVIRSAVQRANAQYWEVVTKRGFAYLAENEEVKAVTREQTYLLDGLIWAWSLEVLPEILRRSRIVEVEHDDTYVFDCTCGLGDGTLDLHTHEERGCHGMGLMCRPDFIAETRQTLELEYHEFKTTSMDSSTFRDKWEVMIQMFAATLDAERRWEKHIQSIYVHGLIKGKRQGEYSPETGKYDGPMRQSSPFVYGYRKPANPPMEQEEWRGSFEYWDDFEQKTKRLGKAFRKTGVWELPDDVIPPGQSKAEAWVRILPSEVRRKQLVLLGPFTRQTQMVEHFLQECAGEEHRIQEGLWQLYDLAESLLEQAETPDYWTVVWPHPEYQALMDRLFPRSYECRRYGMRNRCQFEDPCLGREGWADPIGSGKFIERVPHHKDELDQMGARGLTPEDPALAEETEMELP